MPCSDAPPEGNFTVNTFFSDGVIELALQRNWDVQVCRMAGHDGTPLTNEEMRDAIRNPFGTARLSEMLMDANHVCILFDDIPKPAPTSRTVPPVGRAARNWSRR